MAFQSRIIRWVSILILIFDFIVAAWMPWHQDIYFNSDIARDFLLINDVITTKKMTLIGARAGGIPGVFYGPLWIYVNLPVYFLSGGNPVMQGWFWVGLYILDGGIIFLILKNTLKHEDFIYLGTALWATILAPAIPSSIAHLGAILLSPLWFYLTIKYAKTIKLKYLILSYLTVGIIGHFQVAFAGPMAVLQSLWLIYFLRKRRKLSHLLSILVLLIPLAAFMIFEIRHNWLQTQAILSFITSKVSNQTLSWWQIWTEKVKLMLTAGWGILPAKWAYLTPIIMVIGGFKLKGFGLIKNWWLILFGYFYLGFWLIMFLFKGTVWNYYYWPFMPISVISLMIIGESLRRKWAVALIGLILLLNLIFNIKWLKNTQKVIGREMGSWKFHYDLALKVFSTEPQNFGYFVYTPDQYGYQDKYAIVYAQKKSTITALANKKALNTVIIIAPDSPDNPYTSAEYFIREKVKISSAPYKTDAWPNNYKVVYYQLNKEEIDIPTDNTIVPGLYFR